MVVARFLEGTSGRIKLSMAASISVSYNAESHVDHKSVKQKYNQQTVFTRILQTSPFPQESPLASFFCQNSLLSNPESK